VVTSSGIAKPLLFTPAPCAWNVAECLATASHTPEAVRDGGLTVTEMLPDDPYIELSGQVRRDLSQ
jgi:hypothetical protein